VVAANPSPPWSGTVTRTRRRGEGSNEAARLEEGRLLVRHCRGDGDAFARFVAFYRRPVYGYLVRCGVDEPSRDDLFQEVFLRIHGAAATYHPERPVKPWVFAIAANVVRDHYRRSRSGADVPAPDPSETRADAPDGQQLLEARETVAWIEREVAALPLSQREVVALCCIEQLPQEDVAATLGIPVNTVKTHLRRARIALAQALARRKAALRREVST
jgi:RNA polymerase sigma-70 factor (ECF subfamily)